MSALSFKFHFFLTTDSLPLAFFILFFAVDPSPLASYGCHLTRSDPIIFVSWVLLLLYDTGAGLHNGKQNAVLKKYYNTQVMLILMAIPAWSVCELVSTLI